MHISAYLYLHIYLEEIKTIERNVNVLQAIDNGLWALNTIDISTKSLTVLLIVELFINLKVVIVSIILT